MDASIRYIQMPLGVWKTDLRRLLAEVPWEDRVEARREAFMAETPLSYAYGRPPGTRTYVAVPFAAGVDQVLVEVNRALQSVEPGWGRLNGAVLNCYRGDRNALGWHADDSPEMDMASPIAVVSFGATRPIEWRSREPNAEIHRLDLVDGSLFVMPPGFQADHDHRIPKCGFRCGPRASITLRRFL